MNNNKTIYKKTPLGKIPGDWDVKHFEDVTDIDKESLNGSTSKDYEFDYISLSDVDSDDFKIETTKQVFVTAPSRARRIVKKGDILMATVRPNLQGFSLIRDDVKNLIASTGFAVITTKKCNNEFLYQYLFSSGISKQLYQLLVGSNYPAINSSDVRKLKIPLPPLPEQKTIARLLSTWDEASSKTQALIGQKEVLKKWLMQNLLTGKKRLKGFSGEWKKYSYEKLLKVVKRTVEWNDDELYHLISVRRRSGGIFFRDTLYGHQIKVKDLRTVHEGDFLFSKMQILHGASALVTKEFAGSKISGSYIAVVSRDPNILNMEYFNYASQLKYFYHQTYISSYGVHIEKMTFDFEIFLSLETRLPSFDEQTAIARVLQSADNEIQLIRTKTEKLKEQKKGLMQVLLTGKKRVKIM
ncbi:MAG: restriction endonuclease subunit S [Bacteroidales bacterium]|nr:restriction endonuclease subunit S [Bacteroidales bacterium]